jgi:hypothetical protein
MRKALIHLTLTAATAAVFMLGGTSLAHASTGDASIGPGHGATLSAGTDDVLARGCRGTNCHIVQA